MFGLPPACRDGTAKIADLGMAKIVGREFSAVSGNLGTLAWVSAAQSKRSAGAGASASGARTSALLFWSVVLR